ncbi:class I adenylate-forming enzyme family protein [Bdellovibrio sp. HCB185ZH]|uniref:class I adenylate-forming enzyme family protein n=1 Tax=Bdellovibrio sp. HCB185ZH TaxID=3394235 RepID=UPI0039A5396B
MIDFLIESFKGNREKECIIFNDRPYLYRDLLNAVEIATSELSALGAGPGDVVSIEGDYNPISVAFFLATLEAKAVAVPLTESVKQKKAEFKRIAEVTIEIKISQSGELISAERTNEQSSHEILQKLKVAKNPGLILFSSGSTGASKAAVHDMVPFLEKFKTKRHSRRAITFLLFDHIGGLNTLLYALSNGGTVITVSDRTPNVVLKAIDQHQVEVLPTSPTFLNLLILSESINKYNLSSLKLITYGTEMMPESTLSRMRVLMPGVELLQTYGLSEVGILRSKSESSDSLWVKIGGDGFETRVSNGMLEIKAKSAMLGYLNAPSPFTADGWFITKDLVETKGEYFKFLGRQSDIINVGGEKVYPAEVENEILTFSEVSDVIVQSEKNALTGNMVVAKIHLNDGIDEIEFKSLLRKNLLERLPSFKVPQKFVFSSVPFHTERFKRQR